MSMIINYKYFLSLNFAFFISNCINISNNIYTFLILFTNKFNNAKTIILCYNGDDIQFNTYLENDLLEVKNHEQRFRGSYLYENSCRHGR